MALSDMIEAKALFERLFRETDTDGNGSLSLEEFGNLLKRSCYKFSDLQVKAYFRSLDADRDNTISQDEFLEAMTGIPMVDHRRALWRKAFEEWDADGSGEVDRDEVMKVYKDVLGRDLEPKEADKIFTRLDKDKSGKISWEEFAQYFASL